MFVLCPHCQFLVGVDPRTGQPPGACPNCGGAMESEGVGPAAAAPVDDVPELVPATTTADAQGEPEPEPPLAPAQLNADDVIAAMAQKTPRKGRAKPARSEATAKPAPARRKRAEAPEDAPASRTEPLPATPARPPGPSLSTRLSAWLRSRKPARKPKPVQQADAFS